MSKLFDDGAYAHQRLNLGTKGKTHGRNAKASNRTCEIRLSGIIGGPRETQPWWNCDPASQTERARTVTLHLPGRRARALSQPRGNGEQQLGGTYGVWRLPSTQPIGITGNARSCFSSRTCRNSASHIRCTNEPSRSVRSGFAKSRLHRERRPTRAPNSGCNDFKRVQ
jgi:hypothetical protein